MNPIPAIVCFGVPESQVDMFLEHEGVLLSKSVWVRGPDVPGSAPDGVLAAFDAKGPGVDHLVSAFGRLVG